MRYSFSVLVIMMGLVSVVHADITFLRIYETGVEWAEPGDVIETSDGGYACITSGISWSLLRTDEYGEVLVQKISPWEHSLCENQDSELVGPSFSYSGGEFHVKVVWTDLMCTVLREKVFDELGNFEYITLSCIIQTSDKGYVICGDFNQSETGFIMKLDSLENYEWHIMMSYGDYFNSIVEDSDNCLIAGGSTSMDYVIKLSQDGYIIWENEYPCSSTYSGIYGIQATSSGYVFASMSGRVVGISSSGIFEWQYEAAVPEILYNDVCVSPNGDVVACGFNDESGVLTRLTPDGSLVWEKEYESCRLGYIYSTEDSGFVSAGRYPRVEQPYWNDILLLKVDSEGNYETQGIEPELQNGNAQLLPVHPNPITESATIEYILTEPGAVFISVFDVSGRLISSPVDCNEAAGTYSFVMSDLPSGMYMVRMRVAEKELLQRFVVIE